MTTTTAFTGPDALFSVIPVVLIVSSAILLDHAMRHETVLHRCQIQIWMWLALSLTSSIHGAEWNGSVEDNKYNNDTTRSDEKGDTGGADPQVVVCFVWAHLVVFFNLAAILTESLQSHSVVAPLRWKQNVRNALRIMPLSAWSSMGAVVACSVLSTVTTRSTTSEAKTFPQVNSVWKFSLWTFVATFLALWLVRMAANRRRKFSMDMQGMPTTMPTADRMSGGGIMARLCGMGPLASAVDYKSSVQAHATQGWVDERQWYTWNRIQTIQWFAQQLSNNEEERDMVVSILAPHYITGEVLDGLTDVSQLVALRVPFGPACRLSDSIAGLVERYPKPRTKNGTTGRRTTRGGKSFSAISDNDMANRRLYDGNGDDCLDLHDHEYNNESRPQQRMEERQMGVSDGLRQRRPDSSQVPENHNAYPNEPVYQGGMSEEQHEKLNNVMKERFGLELPKLKANDFLAVQKGLSNKAKNDVEFQPSSNDGMPRPHSFASTHTTTSGSIDPALKSGYANGTTVPLRQQTPGQVPPNLSSAVNDRILTPSSPSTTSIPEHILEGMPPELREIAKRRPDLVETIWKRKQQGVLQQQRKPSVPPTTGRYDGLPALPENSREDSMVSGENQVNAGDDEYDTDDEDETTSLIHRDNNNSFPGRYKSIDKSIIPSIV